MAKSITRRDIIKLVGGSVAGIVFSPVPWKLLDDISIWSQNWSWMPVPLRGDINNKYNTCTICPAGCAVRLRCVGDQPVSVWGIKNHPLNDGALCPLGFGAHHLPYHPSRIKEPVQIKRNARYVETIPIDRDTITSLAAELISAAGPGERIAVLDQRPGRTISYLYRHFLARIPNGTYLCTGSEANDTYEGIYAIMGEEYGPLGIDIDNVRTIVSFGAPVTEGWGIPGRIQSRIKKNGAAGKGFRLIQIETRFSHTASNADMWIPVKPGTEPALALGIAYVLINENLVNTERVAGEANDYRQYLELVQSYSPEVVDTITGIKHEDVRSIARSIVNDGPAVIVCGREPAGGPLSRSEQIAISGLNFLAGSVSTQGGYVSKRHTPIPPDIDPMSSITSITHVPDQSIALLIVDEAESGHAVPWSLIEKKLKPETGVVISLSSYLVGKTKNAQYAVPAPTYLESYYDVPSSFDAVTATYSISSPMVKPRFQTTEPLEFLNTIAKKAGIDFRPAGSGKKIEDYIRDRAEEIYNTGKGFIFTGSTGRITAVADIPSTQQLWGMLTQGGCWIDEPPVPQRVKKYSLLGSSDDYTQILETLKKPESTDKQYPITLMAFGWRGVVDSGPVSPLLTKLYQETEFRECTNKALVHPETASIYRLRDGRRAILETEMGRFQVSIQITPTVMPGVIHVAVGPDQDSLNGGKKVTVNDTVLSVCITENNRTWRITPARVAST
jgi:menaquinone reductase, molybdopterin-binding-like subunit